MIRSLMYHDVVPLSDPDASGFPGRWAASYKVEPDRFARHLDALERRMDGPPLADRGAERPASGWAITFDDGGVSAYEVAAPMLEERGWRGHFFMTTDRIGDPAFLDEDQLRALDAAGHVVGSHSCSHPDRFSALSVEAMVAEWRDSVARLAEVLGREVRVASVPAGAYSADVARTAAEAGLRRLFTSEPVASADRRFDGLEVLGRYTIRDDTPAESAAALASGRPLAVMTQWATWNGRKAIRRVAGGLYRRVAERRFEREG